MDELWRLFQYGKVVSDFCEAVSDELWDAIEDRLATLMERGNQSAMPVSESIGDGLFVLRANHDNQQARLFYFFGPDRRTIIFVHALQKKTRALPQEDIDKAAANRVVSLALLKQSKHGVYEFSIEVNDDDPIH